MATVLPFKAVRPQAKYAADVAALPYDVMTREEGHRGIGKRIPNIPRRGLFSG